MAFNPFKKVVKTVSNIAKSPTDLRSWGDLTLQTVSGGQVDTRGINNPLSGKSQLVDFNKSLGLSDVLLGKKQKDINPDEIANQIRATQSQGIGELNQALNTPAENIVRQQVGMQEKGILGAAQDARRRAQQLMAQRGLGSSSLGLGIQRATDQESGRDIASLRAQVPGLIRNQAIQDATTRIGVGGINQGGINFNQIQGQREGGLLGYASAFAPMAGSIGQLMSGSAALNMANSFANSVPQTRSGKGMQRAVPGSNDDFYMNYVP